MSPPQGKENSRHAPARASMPPPASFESLASRYNKLTMVASSNHPASKGLIAGSIRDFPHEQGTRCDRAPRDFRLGDIIRMTSTEPCLDPWARADDPRVALTTKGPTITKERFFIVIGCTLDTGLTVVPLYTNGGKGPESIGSWRKKAFCFQVLTQGEREVRVPGIRNGEALEVISRGWVPKKGSHARVSETKEIDFANPIKIAGKVSAESVRILQLWRARYVEISCLPLDQQDAYLRRFQFEAHERKMKSRNSSSPRESLGSQTEDKTQPRSVDNSDVPTNPPVIGDKGLKRGARDTDEIDQTDRHPAKRIRRETTTEDVQEVDSSARSSSSLSSRTRQQDPKDEKAQISGGQSPRQIFEFQAGRENPPNLDQKIEGPSASKDDETEVPMAPDIQTSMSFNLTLGLLAHPTFSHGSNSQHLGRRRPMGGDAEERKSAKGRGGLRR